MGTEDKMMNFKWIENLIDTNIEEALLVVGGPRVTS